MNIKKVCILGFIIFGISFSIVKDSISQMKIGVALPLMKESADPEEKRTGQQFINGINDALADYNAEKPSLKITFAIEDTKRESETTLEIFNKLGTDKNIIAIFGPIYSSDLVNNTGASSFHKIPIVTPTATANFLAQNSPYLFQLNPTYDIRGRLMAKYAMTELGMKNFLILSEDGYGKNISESFIDEIKKREGTIDGTEYYSKDSLYITTEIKNLKAKIFEKDKFIDFGNLTENQNEKLKDYNLKYSTLDSLVYGKIIVSVYKLFGKGADRIMDSLKIFPSTLTDKTMPVVPGYIDAIYIPVGSFNDIGKISLQYFNSGINLPILGTSDWNNEQALNENSPYIDELYFDSDFYLNDNVNVEISGLSDSDLKNYYFGYDGMKLLLDKIAAGNDTREKLNTALENTKDYKATHNDIDITERTNRHMSIMLFTNGKMKKISDFVY